MTNRHDTELPTNETTGRVFAAAVVLARKGRYAEATEMLQRARDANDCAVVDALDLQARILAQQGLFLEAESCWQEARSHGGETSRYDEALGRLRRERSLVRRLPGSAAVLVVSAIVAMLVWQVMFIGPRFRARLGTAEASFSALRGDFGSFQDSARHRDEQLARRVTDLGNDLNDMDSRIGERLKLLSTAASSARDRDAIVKRLGAQMAELQNVLARHLEDLSERRAEMDVVYEERLRALEMSLAGVAETVASIDETLDHD